MKINKTRYDIIKMAIADLHYYKDYVNVYAGGNEEGIIEWEVNWAAYGAQTPDKAEEYARKIMKSARLADKLNRLELEVVYEADAKINTKTAYDKELKEMKAMIDIEAYTVLEDWIAG